MNPKLPINLDALLHQRKSLSVIESSTENSTCVSCVAAQIMIDVFSRG